MNTATPARAKITPDTLNKGLGSFYGLALGDALGMPTQSLSRTEITEDYPMTTDGVIEGLMPAGPRQVYAAGMPAGSITDDTEQAILLAEHLIQTNGNLQLDTFASALLDWEKQMEDRGSLDLLGPSTKAALQRLLAGTSIEDTGKYGSTNGAAMRITPVGIAFDVSDLSSFVDTVAHTCKITHNTSLGIASACAVGAAISAGINGATVSEAIEVAIAAAEEGSTRGYWVEGGNIAARLRWAIPYLTEMPASARPDALYQVIGTSVASQESVVAAIALAHVAEDPWQAICLAASLGGDTDTIAAMTGAILGATQGLSVWPATALATVKRVNDLQLESLTKQLLVLRHC